MPECIIHINESGISNTAAWERFRQQLKPGRYLITAKDLKKRSLNQNSWFHVICPDVMRGLQDMGWMEIDTPAKAKAYLKKMFFQKSVTNGIEYMELTEDTSDTSQADFRERSEKIIIWAADYLGIDIAPPAGQTKMFNEQNK
jgi:hypothetical protein